MADKLNFNFPLPECEDLHLYFTLLYPKPLSYNVKFTDSSGENSFTMQKDTISGKWFIASDKKYLPSCIVDNENDIGNKMDDYLNG
jgi:hypothetical protein